MSRWREVVREELARYRAQTELAVVSRRELLDQSLPRLEAEFPDNNTHEQSLSRTLQELRDCGEIGFLSEGTYRILSLDADSDAATDAAARSGVEVTYTASEYETTATGRPSTRSSARPSSGGSANGAPSRAWTTPDCSTWRTSSRGATTPTAEPTSETCWR